MSDKDWDDMTADEKANALRGKLEHFINHFNRAISSVTQRLADLENTAKHQQKENTQA